MPEAKEGSGGEARLAIPYFQGPAPSAEAFEMISISKGKLESILPQSRRAGSWLGLRGGGAEHQSPGNFLCRLETIFRKGPVDLGDRLLFALRHRQSALVLLLVAEPKEVWIAVHPPPKGEDEELKASRAVEALVLLIDSVAPHDCAYSIGGIEVGVRNGEWY
ncbi:MAG: hypothetical protein N2515_04580 [Deltaproteobacteria bacterium]|nr:hypothetical protein [Deltaproteobacteria bacterium]